MFRATCSIGWRSRRYGLLPRRLLRQAPPYLKPGGALLMEVGAGQAASQSAVRPKRRAGFVSMMFFGMKAGSTALCVVRREPMERAYKARRHPPF